MVGCDCFNYFICNYGFIFWLVAVFAGSLSIPFSFPPVGGAPSNEPTKPAISWLLLVPVCAVASSLVVERLRP